MANYKKTILIDLDGVLNNYIKYDENSFSEVKSGAKEFLEKLYLDYDLILFTTRNLLQGAKWLIQNDLDKYFKNITNVKVPAYLQIDDRAIKFNGDFNETLADIESFKPYWK